MVGDGNAGSKHYVHPSHHTTTPLRSKFSAFKREARESAIVAPTVPSFRALYASFIPRPVQAYLVRPRLVAINRRMASIQITTRVPFELASSSQLTGKALCFSRSLRRPMRHQHTLRSHCAETETGTIRCKTAELDCNITSIERTSLLLPKKHYAPRGV